MPTEPFITLPIYTQRPRTGPFLVLLDSEDLYKVQGIQWYARPRLAHDGTTKTWVAIHRSVTDGVRSCFLMHRLILQPPPDFNIRHINKNCLDNRKSNLQLIPQKSYQKRTPKSHTPVQPITVYPRHIFDPRPIG